MSQGWFPIFRAGHLLAGRRLGLEYFSLAHARTDYESDAINLSATAPNLVLDLFFSQRLPLFERVLLFSLVWVPLR